MDNSIFIEILKNYCKLASKIYFYASNENGTRYVNFAFKVNGKNLKKNEADKNEGLNIDDSIKKQKVYLDKLQKEFELYVINYFKSKKKELTELKIIFDVEKSNINSVIENDNFSGRETFTTNIFDEWYRKQK